MAETDERLSESGVKSSRDSFWGEHRRDAIAASPARAIRAGCRALACGERAGRRRFLRLSRPAAFPFGRLAAARRRKPHRKPHHEAAREDARELKREEHPQGPFQIVVEIAKQEVELYGQNGFIARAPISTGMPGHPTPLGVFTVLSKAKWHQSNIYSGAPMPYMQRITWSGVAMHAGPRPGYPASHGCIRLPEDFAVWLFQDHQGRRAGDRDARAGAAGRHREREAVRAGDVCRRHDQSGDGRGGRRPAGRRRDRGRRGRQDRTAGRTKAERTAAPDLGVREPQAKQGLRAPGFHASCSTFR